MGPGKDGGLPRQTTQHQLRHRKHRQLEESTGRSHSSKDTPPPPLGNTTHTPPITSAPRLTTERAQRIPRPQTHAHPQPHCPIHRHTPTRSQLHGATRQSGSVPNDGVPPPHSSTHQLPHPPTRLKSTQLQPTRCGIHPSTTIRLGPGSLRAPYALSTTRLISRHGARDRAPHTHTHIPKRGSQLPTTTGTTMEPPCNPHSPPNTTTH